VGKPLRNGGSYASKGGVAENVKVILSPWSRSSVTDACDSLPHAAEEVANQSDQVAEAQLPVALPDNWMRVGDVIKELTKNNIPHVISQEMQNSAPIDIISHRVDNNAATSLVRPLVSASKRPSVDDLVRL
jgi:hypothetical protein